MKLFLISIVVSKDFVSIGKNKERDIIGICEGTSISNVIGTLGIYLVTIVSKDKTFEEIEKVLLEKLFEVRKANHNYIKNYLQRINFGDGEENED